MEKQKKKSISRLVPEPSFEEIDHRLACGWFADPQDSAQRKRYIKQISVSQSSRKQLKCH